MHLGVEHAKLTIVDEGALPFVIAARVEAAVRRAGAGRRRDRMRCRNRCSASALAARSAAALASLSSGQRAEVLHQCRTACAGRHHSRSGRLGSLRGERCGSHSGAQRSARGRFRRAERMVRINQLPLGLSDLEEIVPQSPDLILIPKVETPQQVSEVAEAIRLHLQAAAKSPARSG